MSLEKTPLSLEPQSASRIQSSSSWVISDVAKMKNFSKRDLIWVLGQNLDMFVFVSLVEAHQWEAISNQERYGSLEFYWKYLEETSSGPMVSAAELYQTLPAIDKKYMPGALSELFLLEAYCCPRLKKLPWLNHD